jgi:hypothetical protein
MRTTQRLESIAEHLKNDLNARLVEAGLPPVQAWGIYRVDDNRGEYTCVGTVSMWGSSIDEDQRIGEVTIEVRLPSGSDALMDEYQDCLIASLDAGGTFDSAFIETSVSGEEKWPSGAQVHAAVMVQLQVRMNRLFRE